MAPRRRSPRERIDVALGGAEGERLRGLDEFIRSREIAQMVTVLTSDSPQLTDVGSILIRTDRELRRVAAILRPTLFDEAAVSMDDAPSASLPRPIPTSRGGLLVAEAYTGSLHLIVEAYGQVESLFTSRPVSALVALEALSQGAGVIFGWFRRRKPEFSAGLQEQAQLIIHANGNTRVLMGGDTPDQRIDIASELEMDQPIAIANTAKFDDVGPPPSLPEPFDDSDDLVARGRRITHIRTYPDGTQDIIYVEG
jgi:hypothetical protein